MENGDRRCRLFLNALTSLYHKFLMRQRPLGNSKHKVTGCKLFLFYSDSPGWPELSMRSRLGTPSRSSASGLPSARVTEIHHLFLAWGLRVFFFFFCFVLLNRSSLCSPDCNFLCGPAYLGLDVALPPVPFIQTRISACLSRPGQEETGWGSPGFSSPSPALP